MYLRESLDILRPLGMRGAAEIRQLISDYDDTGKDESGGQAAHDRAVAAIPLMAAAIKQDVATLQVVFRQIADDPYTIFLDRVWT
jgi:hypothetical protein